MRYAIKSVNDVLAEVETEAFNPEDDVYYDAEHVFIEREDGEALIGIVLEPDVVPIADMERPWNVT